MTVAVVQNFWKERDRKFTTILGQELRSIRFYRDLRKVNHRHYIDVKLGVGGTNLFDTWKTADGSTEWIEECFGTQPRLTIDEHHLTISNDADEVLIKGAIMKPLWLACVTK